MGRPHPSHPLTASHLTVYENSQVVWKKKLPTDEIAVDEKSMLQDEGVDCSSGCIRAFVWDYGNSIGYSGKPMGSLHNPT